jgi:serine/threonine protein kinase
MSQEKNGRTLIEPQPASPDDSPPVMRTAIAEPGAGGTIAMQPPSEPAPRGAAADRDAFIGQELCGYTIKRKLAEGGMGVVYEGVHRKIGRSGAIKVLKLEYCRSEEVVERFYQEARAVNSIRH